jgi:hypothetical protein
MQIAIDVLLYLGYFHLSKQNNYERQPATNFFAFSCCDGKRRALCSAQYALHHTWKPHATWHPRVRGILHPL